MIWLLFERANGRGKTRWKMITSVVTFSISLSVALLIWRRYVKEMGNRMTRTINPIIRSLKKKDWGRGKPVGPSPYDGFTASLPTFYWVSRSDVAFTEDIQLRSQCYKTLGSIMLHCEQEMSLKELLCQHFGEVAGFWGLLSNQWSHVFMDS